MKKLKFQKLAQEEIIGFVLIVVLVGVILLVFLVISLRTGISQDIESYEAESFIQVFLQQTSDCKNSLGYLSVEDLIFGCINSEKCTDSREECKVLDEISENVVKSTWKTENRPVKGYDFQILKNKQEAVLDIKDGNFTNNYRGTLSEFSRGENTIQILFKIYF